MHICWSVQEINNIFIMSDCLRFLKQFILLVFCINRKNVKVILTLSNFPYYLKFILVLQAEKLAIANFFI